MAKLASLVVKVGALTFIIFLPLQYAILLQLLGGIWILETFPAIIFGLFTRWFHHRALLAGWITGMISGTAMVAASGFKSSIYTIHFGSLAISAFAGVFALALNLLVSIALTLICDATEMKRLADITSPEDYDEDAVALHAMSSGKMIQ
jgi:SSS family solute:Na+ symporter